MIRLGLQQYIAGNSYCQWM